MTTGTAVATPRKPTVSVLERLATVLTSVSALILTAYFLTRINVITVDRTMTWESIAVLTAPLDASALGVVAVGFNWIGRRRLRRWARRMRQQRAQENEEQRAEKRARGASLLLGVPASLQNLPDYLAILRQMHILSALFTTAVMVTAVSVTVVNDGPRVPAASFTVTAVQYCRTPLESIYHDAAAARDDALHDATDAQAFIADMNAHASALQADGATLSPAVSALQAASPPDSKYSALRTDCLQALQQAISLLNTPTVPVSPPFPRTVSGIDLVRDASAFVTSNPSTLFQVAPIVHQALDTALNNEVGLNQQLQSDAQQVQNNLLAP
jgi:hypothetical protein